MGEVREVRRVKKSIRNWVGNVTEAGHVSNAGHGQPN